MKPEVLRVLKATDAAREKWMAAETPRAKTQALKDYEMWCKALHHELRLHVASNAGSL